MLTKRHFELFAALIRHSDNDDVCKRLLRSSLLVSLLTTIHDSTVNVSCVRSYE